MTRSAGSELPALRWEPGNLRAPGVRVMTVGVAVTERKELSHEKAAIACQRARARSGEEPSQVAWISLLMTARCCSLLLPYSVRYREVTSKSAQSISLTIVEYYFIKIYGMDE